jgi:hypothetical protein
VLLLLLHMCFRRCCLSTQLVEHVLAAAPPDEHVLNMLLLVLKPANKMAALLPAYEAACSKAPGDEELTQGLFACHVRWAIDLLKVPRHDKLCNVKVLRRFSFIVAEHEGCFVTDINRVCCTAAVDSRCYPVKQ